MDTPEYRLATQRVRKANPFVISADVTPHLQTAFPAIAIRRVHVASNSLWDGNAFTRARLSKRHHGKLLKVQVPLLAGPYSRSFEFDPSQSTEVIGIAFRPGAGHVFFPVAAHELHNTDIALSELHPEEANRLLNDVCSQNNEEQFLALERYLNGKLADAAPTHPAVWHAVEQLSREGGVRSIRKIQTDTGLSHTRFIELFREHVGLTPKLFGRVQRFRTSLDRIEKSMIVNWAELAADCGYFDQAHFIHDFRAFANMTPLEYRRIKPGAELDNVGFKS